MARGTYDSSKDKSTGKDKYGCLGGSNLKGAKVPGGTDIIAKRRKNDKLLGS